jgi:hypothetical protein
MKPTNFETMLLCKLAATADELVAKQAPAPSAAIDPELKIKRRRMLMRLLPALLGAAYGGAAGAASNIADHGDTSGLGKILGGAGVGGAVGYGAGAGVSNIREWMGADPMLKTVRAV